MLCISLNNTDRETYLPYIEQADMAEIRIDMAGFSEEDISYIAKHATRPLIATCRPEFVDDARRVELLSYAIREGFQYIDIEIESTLDVKNALIPLAKEHGCKIIISYHNYDSTPPNRELHTIIQNCFSDGADIAKVATTATSVQDTARILALYDTYTSLVALAMGAKGAVSRIAMLKLGGLFTFVATDAAHKTAPGQYTLHEAKQLLSLL